MIYLVSYPQLASYEPTTFLPVYLPAYLILPMLYLPTDIDLPSNLSAYLLSVGLFIHLASDMYEGQELQITKHCQSDNTCSDTPGEKLLQLGIEWVASDRNCRFGDLAIRHGLHRAFGSTLHLDMIQLLFRFTRTLLAFTQPLIQKPPTSLGPYIATSEDPV